MKKSLIYIYILLIPVFSFAANVDSLWSVWNNNMQHDTIRLSAINELSYHYLFRQPDTGYTCAQMYSEFALEINNKEEVSNASNIQGISFAVRGNFDSALVYFQNSYIIAKELNNERLMLNALGNLGPVYSEIGNYAKAIDCFMENLRYNEKQGDERKSVITMGNIGVIYFEQYNYNKALKFFTESLALSLEIKEDRVAANMYNNIANVYHKQKQFISSNKFNFKSLKIRESLDDKQGIAMSYTNIGANYMEQRVFELATQYLNKSLSLSREIGDLVEESRALYNLSLVKKDEGDIREAIILGNQALGISQEVGALLETSETAQALWELYGIQNDCENTLSMYNLYIETRDSILSDDNHRALISKEFEYEYNKKKVIDDKENEKKVAIEKEKQKRQFIVLIIVITASALVLILLIIIYRRLRITRKQKIVIEEQKEEVETQRDQIEGQKNVIEEKHEEIQESIAYAKRIQEAILPPSSLLNQHLLNNFVYYQPKDVVAGDFYWLETHDELVFFAVADCTGHGVPGAMVSVVCHNALNRAVREFGLKDTGKILDKVRELVLITFEKSEEQMKDGMDICLCLWDKESNTLQFSGANNPLYIVKDNELETIKGTKQPIGHVEKVIAFETHNIDLKDVHSFYLTTDGYADQFGGEKNKKFGYKQMREILLDNSEKTMEEQKSILSKSLATWIEQGDDEQIDDICIIGIKV